MSEPRRIANLLVAGTDHCAAAILVALHDSADFVPLRSDAHHVRALRSFGCIKDGTVTPLGAHVAMILRATGRVLPYPGALT